MFGDGILEKFDAWISKMPRKIYPNDFLYQEKQGFCWLYLYEGCMNVPEDFAVIDFKGGLYAVATDIDQKTDRQDLYARIDAFLEENGFVRDPARPEMGNVITASRARKTLGYDQMNYWIPITEKNPAQTD